MKFRVIIQSVLVVSLLCFNPEVSIAAANVSLVMNTSSAVVGGNVTAPGVADASLTISSNSQPTADNQAPTWPSSSSLIVANITQTGLTLTWTAAMDNMAVTGYKIYQDSTLLGSVNNSTLTYSIAGLTTGTQYTFQVQAGDAAGNWSTDGPNVSLTTAVPITTMSVTVDDSAKNLAVTSTTVDLQTVQQTPVTVTVPSSVTDATIDVSSLLNTPVSGTVTTSALPAMTITANTSLSATSVQVSIPSGETISSEASDWSGTIKLPTVIANNSVTVTPDSGYTATVNAAVEVGYGNVPLTLSTPVKILLPGQAGKNVGYVRGTTFTKITNALTQDSGDSLAPCGDGYLNVGSDLVIWTRHFTEFVAYTETSVPSGGGGIGVSSDTQPPQWPANATVTVSKNQGTVYLSWPAATDNVGVTSYRIYETNVSGTPLATVNANSLFYSYNDLGAGSGSETYYVEAGDAAGNWSTAISGTLTTGQGTLDFYANQSYLVTVSGSTANEIGPIAGSTSVPLNPTIMLYFDRGVTNDSVWNNNQSCITLKESSGASIPIKVFWLTNQPGTIYVHDILFSPLSNLTPGNMYTITISKNLTANNGHTLGQSDGNIDQTVSFTVAGSNSVSGVNPTNPTNPTNTTPPTTPPISTTTTVDIGGDNTTYNQAALATLTNATFEQIQNAQLPAGAATVSSAEAAPVTLTTSDRVQIIVPPGAVSTQAASVKMTVAIGTVTTPPQAEKTAVVLNPLKYERQFEVTGQTDGLVQFSSPVTITFPIATTDLPARISPQQLAVYWWDLARNDWVKLGGVYDPTEKTISVPTYHFSTYAVMADTSIASTRLSGTDRSGTAIAVADQGWKAGADNVVLANAYTFPDALAAGPLAYKLDAPILLTDTKTLTPSTFAEIKKLAPKTITLIGGTAVISQDIQDSLSEIYGQANVIRYGGADRNATAATIAAALGTTGKAVVANGEDGHYADALAVYSYAAYNGIPILFTGSSVLPAATVQALTAQKVKTTIVVGGEGAVSAAVYNQLPGAARYGGSDRYATATATATGLHLNLKWVYIVTGLDFPDALVVGNLAAHSLSPLILVDKEMPTATADFILANKAAISGLTTVGGEGAVTPVQDNALRYALQNSGPGGGTGAN